MSSGATGEIRRSIYIAASPATVFTLLTDPARMKTWLAEIVEADVRPSGVFRISEPSGTTIEGTYVEILQDRRIVFTWGGIMGLVAGQTTVEITLEPQGHGTLVKLRQFGLPKSAIEPHDSGWAYSALPKLRDAAEGRDPGGLCLGDLVHQTKPARAANGRSRS